ncbi:MAG TPA: hypothetical protein VM911_11035 [Pyrinomonadaceae bacterium]|nr:hypothetical protein [Pyrinomonadaceae bacterium]
MEATTLSWRDRVAAILQPGWEVTQTDTSIVITRKEPVTYYNPIALPPPGKLRAEMIERSRHQEKYQITLDIVEKLSDARYEELKAVNLKTEKELEAREDAMRSFAGKGDFMPNTPKEKALYQEYQLALSSLPFHRLPDMFDEKHSIYVKTTRHPWSAFYFSREELECRAILENIYSFADVYEGKRSIPWPPGAEYARVAAFEAFDSRRSYDRYLHKKEMNLKAQRKD